MQSQCIPLPISRTTEYGFAFVEEIPLDERFKYTPMWQQAPIAPAVLSMENGHMQWKVLRCPYCAYSHYHNLQPHKDPRLFLGGRASHCLPTVPEDPRGLTEYRLIAIDGEPTPEGIDRYFPMYWDVGPISQPQPRTQPSRRVKTKVWRKSMGFCWYCGIELDPFTNFEVDHFLSLKNGGDNSIANLVPSCKSCNSQKSHWHIEVFRTRHHTMRRFWFETAGKGGDRA